MVKFRDFFFLDQDCCPICKERKNTKSGLCQACYDELLPLRGKTMILENYYCHYGFFYNSKMANSISRFKFQGQVGLYKALGQLLYEVGEDFCLFSDIDLICPVPMHRFDQNRRGYNQSSLLASYLSHMTGIPQVDILTKKKLTKRQLDLSAKKREENLRGAFELTGDVKGMRILLIDDILTTGSTLRESGRTIMGGGPKSLSALVLCTASRK